MSRRQHQVQTPGAPAAAQSANPQPPADTPKVEQTPGAPAGRPDHRQMRAKDINPATLTAPVLSRDGWVMPIPKTERHPAQLD